MKLIIEDIDHTLIKPIIESKGDGTKKYYLTGPFAEAVTKNRNGRTYPKAVLENAVNRFRPMIESRRAIGELNHPPTPQVNPREASHKIMSLEWDNNLVVGKAKIMTEMPTGKIVKALMDEDIQLGMSTRGMGSIKNIKDINEVQDDYRMNTIDIVSDPSGISCFVNGIMENADWIYEASTDSWMLAEDIKKEIKKISSREVGVRQAMYFQKFLESIK